ncbi:MAG TPA: universal stress protein [Methanobacterium sp.]|nr:universal stress protein [Methanobacterium sp.]
MYKKILVTSTGEYLDEIIEHTLDLIDGRSMEVIGLYVADTSAPFLTPSKVKQMMVNELKSRGKEILDGMEQKFKKADTIKFKPMLIEGDPAEKIVETAEEENVDVIIMGTGKSKIDKHLLGSVSEKVVHSAPCTVLLIRSKHKPLEQIK